MMQTKAARRGSVPRILLVLALLAGAGGGVYWWKSQQQDGSEASSASGKEGQGKRGGDRPNPVALQKVEQRDIRVIVPAIGTATPKALVTVRTRVDGELLRVHFREGELVRQGQLLAEIDPRALEAQVQQTSGQLLRDQALLQNAKADLARYRELLAKDSISSQQVDTQAALVSQYQGTVQADQGALDQARLQVQYSRITAPIAGRAGLRSLDTGNHIKASDTNGLTTIAQVDTMNVVFAMSETALPDVLKAQRAGKKLVVEAWDREFKNRLAVGHLSSLDNQIDVSTGTVKLKAEFSNKSGALFPNQFVNVRLVAGVREKAMALPSSAILRGSKGSFVYKALPDNTVQSVAVTVGAVEGEWCEVLGDLNVGDAVVADGTDKLRDGAKIAPPGASKPAKKP